MAIIAGIGGNHEQNCNSKDGESSDEDSVSLEEYANFAEEELFKYQTQRLTQNMKRKSSEEEEEVKKVLPKKRYAIAPNWKTVPLRDWQKK